jgi:DNA-binding NtrC family response regulator
MESDTTGPESIRPPHVLVVDDHEDTRESIGLMLELCDCGSSLAATLEMAKVCLSRERYDLVILDVEMIDGNGIDLAVLIRSGPHSFATDRMVPIIISTGHIHIDRLVEQIGPRVEVQVKPITPAELAPMLIRLLPGHRFEPLSQHAIDAVLRRHGQG